MSPLKPMQSNFASVRFREKQEQHRIILEEADLDKFISASSNTILYWVQPAIAVM